MTTELGDINSMANMLDVYEYNQHFVAMMNIINAARLNPPKEGHKHHIVPKCWYRLHNIPVDNSDDNLVLLTYEDHIKVHKLAILCAATIEMKYKMGFAVKRLLKGHFSGMHHTEESKKKISANNAHYWKGKVPPAALANKGRIFTEEHRRKLAEAHLGRTWKVVDGKRVFSKRANEVSQEG